MKQTVKEITQALRNESIRAYNSGRDEEREPLTAMAQRLVAVQSLDPEHRTAKLIVEQALALLHRVWAENPV
jgi:hypothetical protein